MTNIVTVLDDFIFLMERVFKNPNILVPFHEEFARLEAFIRIQKIALFNKVDLAFDCDSQIDSMLTMGFILQPLVENSVFHGIKPKMELERTYTGHILVKGYIQENMIHLHIIDNGIGNFARQNEGSFVGI